MFASVCVRRTARPSWALLLSCAHAPTQNAVRMVRAVVQTGSVTWTAAVKTATALTLWTQHDKTGQSHGPLWWSWNKKKKVYLIIEALWTVWNYPFFLCFLLCSRLIGSASASVISGEEQFEDYGEGEDVDFTPSSPCPEDDTRTNGFSDLGSSLPSRLVVRQSQNPSVILWQRYTLWIVVPLHTIFYF